MKHVPMSQHRARSDLNNSIKNRQAVANANAKPKPVTLPKSPWKKEQK